MDQENIQKIFRRETFQDQKLGALPYRIFVPENFRPNEKPPLLIHMHGMGSVGTDNTPQLGIVSMNLMDYLAFRNIRAVFIAPQSPVRWVDTDWMLEHHEMCGTPTPYLAMALKLIRKIAKEYHVDRKRIYLEGASMGGFASWEMLIRTHGTLFAAAVIMCGGGDSAYAKALTTTPVWCTHGDADNAVPPVCSRIMRDAVNRAGGRVILSEYPNFGHDVWTATSENRAYWDWLFAQRHTSAMRLPELR